ncbi:hypothetical protein Btru_045026 [Bulinus truncatus]|nr:hypothetical protein Btru_045026 [Bulinus truncatus]
MSQLGDNPVVQRSLSEESEILISSESSDDEYPVQSQNHRSIIEGTRSIKSLLSEAKMLLVRAESKSRPEAYKSEAASTYRFPFSSFVKASDLFRDSDFLELLKIVLTLKSRLSAELVFSLGCPTHPEEKTIYDELVMNYSNELIETWRNNSENDSVTQTDEERAHSFLNTACQNNLGNFSSIDRFGPSTSRQTVPEFILQISENMLKNVESTSEENATEKNSPLQNIGDFLKNVQKFYDISMFNPTNLQDRWNEPEIQTVLNAVLNSLAAALKSNMENKSSEVPGLSPSQRKRKRSGNDKINADSKKTKSIQEESSSGLDEEESCSVCLEPWTTGGEHRVTCLKCGHLFGLSCILKWVEQAHCCPQCKASAKKSDLRNIFVTKITAEDTSERDRAVKLLEEEKMTRRQLEQKEAQARYKLEMQMADNEALRNELLQLRSQVSAGSYPVETIPLPSNSYPCRSQTVNSSKRYHLFLKINIAQDGNCRVFDYSKELGMVVVSQKSTNALFRGYGIKMFSREFKPLSYQPLHSAPIRDMCFRPACYDGQLLSCGLDKCIQLSSVTSKVVIQKYAVSSTVWCCAWNTGNTNLFYAGMEKGVVREFDIRRTNTHVQDIMDSGGCPISNIQYWNRTGDNENSTFQGLLIAQLQNLTFKKYENDQYTTHLLPPMQAALMSLSLHSTGHYLASFRPGAQLQKCRYEICSLAQSVEDNALTSSRHAVWDGGNMQVVISRNALISHPESDQALFAVTANHSKNLVNIWDVSKKQEFQSLPCYDKAIDIKSLSHNGDLLGILSEKDLILYKWRD